MIIIKESITIVLSFFINEKMKIEEAIRQPVFKNEKVKANINIIYTANWLQGTLRIFFNRFQLSPQQYNVLRILRGQHPNPISTNEIRLRMLDKMSDVSRIVARLNKTGLIIQKENADDKRLVNVSISSKGLKLLAKIDDEMAETEKIMSGITTEEAKTLNRILDKIRD